MHRVDAGTVAEDRLDENFLVVAIVVANGECVVVIYDRVQCTLMVLSKINSQHEKTEKQDSNSLLSAIFRTRTGSSPPF